MGIAPVLQARNGCKQDNDAANGEKLLAALNIG
jgi:hypothetical protein